MVPHSGMAQQVPLETTPAAPAGGHGQAGEEHTLVDEHAVLLHEIRSRTRAIRTTLGAGRWPAPEIAALVDYLRYELLDQAATEERLLFPLTPGAFSDPLIHGLVEEHVRLRDVADRLAVLASCNPEAGDPADLGEQLDALEEVLDHHMAREEAVLSTTAGVGGVEPLRQPFRCHTWFPVTEGALLDLDALPPEFAHRAVVERLSRLSAGEHVRVRSRACLNDLWSILTGRLPGEFGWVYLEEGPDRWQAEVTRRAPQ